MPLTAEELAVARATNKAWCRPEHCHIGRSGQIEVIALGRLNVLGLYSIETVAIDLDFLPLTVELELLDALAALDAKADYFDDGVEVMPTLAETIAPDWFEVVSTFPISDSYRKVEYNADAALTTARAWCCRRTPCIHVTAYGTTGTPGRDQSFALRNLEWVDDKVLDSGWRGYMGASKFIGALDD